ncbi:hypothetical protein RI367_003616 [Sorochytrium milnesiophthora]
MILSSSDACCRVLEIAGLLLVSRSAATKESSPVKSEDATTSTPLLQLSVTDGTRYGHATVRASNLSASIDKSLPLDEHIVLTRRVFQLQSFDHGDDQILLSVTSEPHVDGSTTAVVAWKQCPRGFAFGRLLGTVRVHLTTDTSAMPDLLSVFAALAAQHVTMEFKELLNAKKRKIRQLMAQDNNGTVAEPEAEAKEAVQYERIPLLKPEPAAPLSRSQAPPPPARKRRKKGAATLDMVDSDNEEQRSSEAPAVPPTKTETTSPPKHKAPSTYFEPVVDTQADIKPFVPPPTPPPVVKAARCDSEVDDGDDDDDDIRVVFLFNELMRHADRTGRLATATSGRLTIAQKRALLEAQGYTTKTPLDDATAERDARRDAQEMLDGMVDMATGAVQPQAVLCLLDKLRSRPIAWVNSFLALDGIEKLVGVLLNVAQQDHDFAQTDLANDVVDEIASLLLRHTLQVDVTGLPDMLLVVLSQRACSLWLKIRLLYLLNVILRAPWFTTQFGMSPASYLRQQVKEVTLPCSYFAEEYCEQRLVVSRLEVVMALVEAVAVSLYREKRGHMALTDRLTTRLRSKPSVRAAGVIQQTEHSAAYFDGAGLNSRILFSALSLLWRLFSCSTPADRGDMLQELRRCHLPDCLQKVAMISVDPAAASICQQWSTVLITN